MLKGVLQGIIVLVPTYIIAYFTDKMVYVIPMLAASSFIAASIGGNSNKSTRRVDEDAYKDDASS